MADTDEGEAYYLEWVETGHDAAGLPAIAAHIVDDSHRWPGAMFTSDGPFTSPEGAAGWLHLLTLEHHGTPSAYLHTIRTNRLTYDCGDDPIRAEDAVRTVERLFGANRTQ